MCARCAASPLRVAPRPGVSSVADTSIEVSLDALMTLREGCYGVVVYRLTLKDLRPMKLQKFRLRIGETPDFMIQVYAPR